MPVTTYIFLAGMALSMVGSLYRPMAGILGYMFVYCANLELQWWSQPVAQYGIRFSLYLAIAIGVGAFLHGRSLRIGRFIYGQEALLLVFLAVVWLCNLLGPPTTTLIETDPLPVKLTKVFVFVFLLTHVVTTQKRLDVLTWMLIFCSFFLGYMAFTTPDVQFREGRLDRVGGVDFIDSNAFAAYCAAMLPIIGMMFVRSRWVGKVACLIAGAFTANAIALTRSRGAVVGLGFGLLAALFFAKGRLRWLVLGLTLLGAAGAVVVVDKSFINRASTIDQSKDENKEESAQLRLAIWKSSWEIFRDNPLGVGPANFFQSIILYDPDTGKTQVGEKETGRDAHNTFIRCGVELGVEGLALLVALMVNALVMIRRVMKGAKELPDKYRKPIELASLGLAVALVTYIGCGLTVTLLYIEALWWLLALPLCLTRCLENIQEDLRPKPPPLVVAPRKKRKRPWERTPATG